MKPTPITVRTNTHLFANKGDIKSIANRHEDRVRIEQEVSEFLASGGTIDVLPEPEYTASMKMEVSGVYNN